MKKGDYLAAKEDKRKSTTEAVVVLIIFIIVFIALIFRFAVRSGAHEGFFSRLPTGAEAYQITRKFVRPTIKSAGDADFPENDFQYSKNSDSVYEIKSYFLTKNNDGHDVKTNFTATVKYNGGIRLQQRNWTLLKLQEMQ